LRDINIGKDRLQEMMPQDLVAERFLGRHVDQLAIRMSPSLFKARPPLRSHNAI
jgi:hypothetical protein